MRLARLTIPGAVHHLVSRFVDRDWFFRDDIEREKYLALLGRALVESDWRCLAWALMSNHIHLAVLAGESSLASWILRVHAPFANWLNERYTRLGAIFAGRPTAWIVRPEHEARLIAYIHNNPVRAGVARRARDSRWTSHGAYLGLDRAPRWLSIREGLARCGCADAEEFDAHVDADVGVTKNDPVLSEIRRAARRRGALELATPLIEPLEVPLVARRFAHIRVDPSELVRTVARLLGIALPALQSASKRPEIVVARRIVVQAGVKLGLVRAHIAAVLGISSQAVSTHALRTPDDTESLVIAEVVRQLDGSHE